MAMWHIMVGIGLSVIATMLTVLANRRGLPTSSKTEYTEYTSPPDSNCPICLDRMFNNNMRYLSCGHALHKECFRNLMKNTCKKCPTCRSPI